MKGNEGRAIACRLRKLRGTELREPCRVCGVADRRVLRRQAFRDGPLVLCANHAAIAGRRRLSCAEFLEEMEASGDRRGLRERRLGVERRTDDDRRAFVEPVEFDAREGDRRRAG